MSNFKENNQFRNTLHENPNNTYYSKKNIPNKIKNTKLYKFFKKNNESENNVNFNKHKIPINKLYFNSDFYKNIKNNKLNNIDKAKSIIKLIKTYDYWSNDKSNSILSDKILDFFIKYKEELKKIFESNFELIENNLRDLRRYPIAIIILILINEREEEYYNIFCQLGFSNILEYMHKNQKQIKCSISNSYTAAENGHLNCLKVLYKIGCGWNERTCAYASENGHLECLEYLYNNGCPWDENTCSRAASKGKLECLKYAHENDCPWDRFTCEYAAENNHLNCLEYAICNGCDYEITYFNKKNIQEFILKLKCEGKKKLGPMTFMMLDNNLQKLINKSK